MREITDHRLNPANDEIAIHAVDAPGIGGACHEYEVTLRNGLKIRISFQNGAIAEAGVNGITHEALLAIVTDRLRSFQAGPFYCVENAVALGKAEEALYWLHERTLRRSARGVEGRSVV